MAEKDIKRRSTNQRRLVYEAVMEGMTHPNADEVFNRVRKRDNKVSRGTVYRNLNLLSENKEILRIETGDSDRFDGNRENHCHIVCNRCKRMFDAPVEYSAKFDSTVEDSTGFEGVSHSTVFYGICPDCQKK